MYCMATNTLSGLDSVTYSQSLAQSVTVSAYKTYVLDPSDQQ